MKQTVGNLWTTPSQVKVVPTNGRYARIDEHVYRAVMGAGVAKQAVHLWPELALLLGGRLQERGNRLYVFQVPPILRDKLWCSVIVAFPTKHHWLDASLYPLIERSALELAGAADQNGWGTILLPKVGCGLGGLEWSEVGPLLDQYLDHRFTVIDIKDGT